MVTELTMTPVALWDRCQLVAPTVTSQPNLASLDAFTQQAGSIKRLISRSITAGDDLVSQRKIVIAKKVVIVNPANNDRHCVTSARLVCISNARIVLLCIVLQCVWRFKIVNFSIRNT